MAIEFYRAKKQLKAHFDKACFPLAYYEAFQYDIAKNGMQM